MKNEEQLSVKFLYLSLSRGAGVSDRHRALHYPHDSPVLVPKQQFGNRAHRKPSVP